MIALSFPPKLAPLWAGRIFFKGLPGRRERRAGRSVNMVGMMDLPFLPHLALRHLFQGAAGLAQMGNGGAEFGTGLVCHACILARRFQRVMRQREGLCA